MKNIYRLLSIHYERNILLMIIFLLSFPPWLPAQNQTESVFHTSRSNPVAWQAYLGPVNSFYGQIINETDQLLTKRKLTIDSLKTEQDWLNYRKRLRDRFYAELTEFKRTPLNPRITGKVEKTDYIIEKVLFESFPQFYVTGCLFLPKERQKPAPAIIYCSGHNADAFRNEIYMKVILNLVYKGFVVFAFDPIGQGERLQYPDESGKSLIGGPTSEHAWAGIQTLLTGHSLTDYFIWDGARVVDYLLTRPEVDASRIGITGRSGGGTQSAMIAAYDERIYAAAPECYITSYRRLIESIGPQDAEQNPFQALKKGFDHADFFHLRAPKPSLMVTTTNDIFSIQGAREVFEEAKASYQAFGKQENMMMTEDLGVHESTLKNRESVYSFFLSKLNLPGNPSEKNITLPDKEELKVTPTGQVVSSFSSKTVFDLNKNFIPAITGSSLKKEEIVPKIKEIFYSFPPNPENDMIYSGRIRKEDFFIDKYFIHQIGNRYAIPYYIGKSPTADNRKMIVLLGPEGKNILLSREKIVSKLTSLGYIILAPDLPGTGELAFTDYKGDSFVKGKSFNHFFGANLLGKSICSITVSELNNLITSVAGKFGFGTADITIIAENEMCIPALLWSVSTENLNQVIFLHPLVSFRSLAEKKNYNPDFMMESVPGLLRFADLPAIEACLAPIPLTIINPVDGAFVPLTDLKPFSIIKEAYKTKKLADRVELQLIDDNESWNYICQKISNSR